MTSDDDAAETDAVTPAPAPPRPGTVYPHLARERALKVLFQADVRGQDPRIVLDRVETGRGELELLDELEPDEDQVAGDADLQRELTRRSRMPLDEYTRILVTGVAAHRVSIDRVLEDVATHWTVARMPVVDRNLLRLAVYELALQDTPPAVVIDEAVSFAGGFAGDKARPFVNGVLETVRRMVVADELELVAEPATTETADTADTGAEREGDAPVAPVAGDDVAWDAALDLLTRLDDVMDDSDDDEA